ncbi:MAG: DUF3179 domain-containing protein [Alphaproteobacteria bacterium]|nr:DUF3179 domain-containing protein [Alphaproteobacteria bacterium]
MPPQLCYAPRSRGFPHTVTTRKATFISVVLGLAFCLLPALLQAQSFPYAEFPLTDFSKYAVPFTEIQEGGPPRDGIPAIDDPQFLVLTSDTDTGLPPTEPVISVNIDGDPRAYPLRYLLFHEIVNDTIGDKHLAITFCPLCNAAVVYDRQVEGTVLRFGTTGRLRHSDLLMYDDATESWWQQFTGTAIIGAYLDTKLVALPSRLESVARFHERHPTGKLMREPTSFQRPYGSNPYRGYDSLSSPFLYRGQLPRDIAPLIRVVSLQDRQRAWSLPFIAIQRQIVLLPDASISRNPTTDAQQEGAIIVTWRAGQNSALDTTRVADGKDVGNIVVQQRNRKGRLEDIPYFIDFAFAYHAFFPYGMIITGAQQ